MRLHACESATAVARARIRARTCTYARARVLAWGHACAPSRMRAHANGKCPRTRLHERASARTR
eukprot:4503967-Alexandrium_andersonii.AAC.1